ncbi:hypothetical protein SAMN05661096_02551 [Marivirga sericea]|uniref:MG2 domain-containing protein n=1 Tax=Marivirga sericea TaxID=1028 RepID=A0A1X7KDI7_9BACT|nr:hypothetical protein [Marivirga sericea]SMG38587.1 hypothetical protein SAMN05661096_02551 [Marivirga sericea]
MKIRYKHYLFFTMIWILQVSNSEYIFAQSSTFSSQREEKVFLQLDKSYYLSGTKLRYSVYVVDAKTHKPSNSGSLLDVKIFNSSSEEIISQKLVLNRGTAEGRLELNKSIASGNYLLLAYTSNSVHSNYKYAFKQKITIVNPRDEGSLADQKEFDLEFYPEGGHIIGGHINTVAFKADYLNDDWTGIVISNEGDTVSMIDPYKLGYGQFSFFAKETLAYSVKIEHERRVSTFELPTVSSTKLTGRIVNIESDTLVVVANIGDNYAGDQLSMLVYNNGEVILGAKQIVKARRMIFNIPKSLMKSGLNSILFYDENQEIISERNYYKRNNNKAPRKVKIDVDKISKNSEVFMPIEIESFNSEPIDIDASISIKNLDYFDPLKFNDMNLYFDMFSALNILDPIGIINQINEDRSFTDIYLKTKSTGLNHIRQLGNQSENRAISDSRDYFMISGRVTDNISDQPIQDSVIYCSVLGQIPQFYASRTDSDGRFVFQLRSFYGKSDIVLKVANVDENQDNLSYQLDRNEVNINDFGFKDDFIFNSIKTVHYLRYHEENKLISRVYDPASSNRQEMKDEIKVTGFFPNYSDSKDLIEYEYLEDFRQISRELLPGVAIKSVGSSDKIFLREIDDTGRNSFIGRFENEPLLLIDGLPVFDHTRILNYSTAKIKILSLVNKKYFINGVFHDGILELSTLDSDYYKKNGTNHHWMSMQGFYQNTDKVSLNYTEIDGKDKLPDFRDVLYWNGSYKIASDKKNGIKFHSSDDEGNFLIELHGIDSSGKIYQGSRTITIEDN